jgi:glycerate 2-kinase
MPRVVLAPDKFKGSLTAAQVAGYLAEGIQAVDPLIDVDVVPVADGGDGLLDAFVAAGYEPVPVTASGPTGEVVSTSWARQGDQAVVELAAVCGLALLGARLAPLTASSRGLGEVIAAALTAGCRRVLVGIGGSASTDGGIGMVQALGARVLDAAGRDVQPGAVGAEAAARLDFVGLRRTMGAAQVDVACDVDNPLTGAHGAAAVYGPQKGASPDDVHRLDLAMTGWADLVAAATGTDHRDDPGAGAAGGVGFAAVAFLGAALRPGADLVLDAMDFGDRLTNADLVITGEGALDTQTLHGKAPARVAARAHAAGIPVVAVAGQCELDATTLRGAGFSAVHTLRAQAAASKVPQDPFRDAASLLRRIGERIATSLAAAAT